MRFALIVAAFVMTADQLVKWWVLEGLGLSFGLFSHIDARWPLVVMACAVSLCLLLWLRGLVKAQDIHISRYSIAIGMVVGGALGNVIDRIRFGAVADFLDVHIAGYHWPSFNVADACIVTGVCFLLFLELTTAKKDTA
jgi:signal peptidase II